MTQPEVNSNPVTIKGIDLSHMPSVAIKQADGKRSYGRRFVVIVNGQASEEMAFKKILKQIKKISHLDQNLTPEEKLIKLQSVQALLNELKQANVHEPRGLVYRIRTWFHQLGNSGSHDKNIERLEQQLSMEMNTADAESTRPNPPLVLNSKPIEKFVEDNFPVFQASIMKQSRKASPIELTIDGYNIKIQDNGTININEDAIIQFNNGKVVDHIPEELVSILQKTFEAITTKESHYNPWEFKIVQSNLSEFPLWHLKQLGRGNVLNFEEVIFLDDALLEQEGADAGGLTRAYISTLVESIQKQDSLFSELKDGLKCPSIKRTQSRNESLLNCTVNEAEVYYNLGRLYLFTHNSKHTTGVYFDDILFQAALSFNRSQLARPFSGLTKAELIQVAKSVVEQLPLDAESPERDNMLIALNLCNRQQLDACLDQEDQIAALKALSTAALVGIDDDGMEAYLDDDFLNANLDAIKADRDGFIDQLYLSILSSNQFITQLNGASLGEILSPIYNMARGMSHEATSWEIIQAGGYAAVNMNTQGGIDRQFIHDALKFYPPIYQHPPIDIETESDWLKEWILNDATNEDIRNFLRFVGGSTSLPRHQKIGMSGTHTGTHPIAHSCGYKIELPKNLNKETFIANLKEAIMVQDFGMY